MVGTQGRIYPKRRPWAMAKNAALSSFFSYDTIKYVYNLDEWVSKIMLFYFITIEYKQ